MRAGAWAIEKAEADRWAFARRHAGMLALLSTAYWIVAGLGWLMAPSGAKGFIGGVAFASYGWMLAYLLAVTDGTESRRAGGQAERWTAEALRKLWPRGWRRVDRLAFAECDVDHVLVGPGGVFAIETKFTTRFARETDHPVRLTQAIEAAHRGVRKTASVLRTAKITTEITPVLVLWGPQERWRAPEGLHPSGVEIIYGLHLRDWRKTLRRRERRLDREDRLAILKTLQDHIAHVG